MSLFDKQPNQPRVTVAVAVGTWRSGEAFAIGASKAFGDVVFKAGASFDSHGTGGANAGVGWQF